MNLAEYLQQFVTAAKNGTDIFCVVSETSGDPQGAVVGEVWGGSGTLRLDSQGDTFTGNFDFSPFFTASPQQPYSLDVKLIVSSAQLTLTVPPEDSVNQFFADHAQLQYSNGGVLYGVITHIRIVGGLPLRLLIEPGPVVTLALNTEQPIP